MGQVEFFQVFEAPSHVAAAGVSSDIFSAVVGVGGWQKPHVPQVDAGFMCGQHFERLEAKTLYANFSKLQKKGGN